MNIPSHSLLIDLLPLMSQSTAPQFNVFDVLHHGTHEKQLSNGFRWILEIGGTHNFQDLGQRLFIDLLNSGCAREEPLPMDRYSVRQEVNTSGSAAPEDIADIVLEGETTVIVIENFHTSDGHGHGYHTYLDFGRRGGKSATVVLLCAEENRSLLTLGWEQARVITYEQFLAPLFKALSQDSQYTVRNPDQYAFIRQMYLKLAGSNGHVDKKRALDFVIAMCETGEAQRYQAKDKGLASETFANDMAQQAREHFDHGRETLHAIKSYLRSYGDRVLRQQLQSTLGYEVVTKVSAEYSGIYQWTINFKGNRSRGSAEELLFQIKFGPSAWHANERDGHWETWDTKVEITKADYSSLFLTDPKRRLIIQSFVSLHDVLSALPTDDTRLHDEIILLLQTP